jgi:hypothetical protein
MKKNEWYINQNLKPIGPLALVEVRERIHRGQIGPSDLVMKESEGDWRPASEWSDFEQTLFPSAQACVQGAGANSEEKEWIVLTPGGEKGALIQEGPFSILEIRRSLQSGQLQPQQYVWKTGLSGWCRLQDRIEFV